jgi:type II secretory pathway component PulF
MPVFEYKATDASGSPITGTLLSTSLVAAAENLAKQGLTVQHVALASSANDPIPQNFSVQKETPAPAPVAPVPEAPRVAVPPPPTEARSVVMTDIVGPLLLKVPLQQLLFFFRQLSTMLNAGVPIISSLDTLARQTRDPRLVGVVNELSAHVREGRPLSIGMQRYPEVFTPLMLSLVRAGEEGGMLDNALKQMADYIEREIQLRNLVRKATIYPKVVVGSSIVIVIAANYIIRSVLGKPGGLTSPLTEPATWLILAPLIAFLFLFFRVGVTNPRVKHNYDAILLMIPAIGSTLHQMAMAKFGRAFAALYKGGVPIGKAVQLAADACGSDYLRSKIYPAGSALEEGIGVTDAFSRTGAFSQTVLDMTQTGEQTGRLDEMLDKVADFYEDGSQVRANQMAIILGVVCLLAVAAYVGYVVISFYSGHMSNLNQAGEG